MKRLAYTFVLLAAAAAFASGKRSITQTDLYSFRWIADPQISPGGSLVAYTLVTVNQKHDGYDTSLWLVSTTGSAPRPLTRGPHDSTARWSPDGKRLAFLRAADKDAKPQIYILPMDGGEASALTGLPKGAAAPVWSPDGRWLAFTSTALAKDIKANAKDKDPEPSDVRIINRAAYRLNGTGYLETDRPNHLWIAEVPASPDTIVTPRQITSGPFIEADPTWSANGAGLYFTSNRTLEPYYEPQKNDIYFVNRNGGEPVRIASTGGPIYNLALNSDRSRLAFIGSNPSKPEKSYTKPDLFITTVDPGSTPKNLTGKYDYDIGGGVGGDQHPPRGATPTAPFWSRDGRSLFVVSSEEGRANLQKIDTETGKVEPLTHGDHAIYAYTATPDGAHAAIVISTPVTIGDLYVLDTASGTTKQLTHVNDELFSDLNLTAPETIWYKSFDGKRIETWAQRPPDFDPNKKYPVILNIHGGPHAAYGYTFDHEFQWMAAKGYIVLYPNPRGSTSYGQEFGNIIQFNYPGDDYKDLMAGVDALIARGWADADRLGVTGGSGGGVLTNWVIGHTNRFKAAVSQRSIADWSAFWYTADFTLFGPTWFRAAPWEEEADFKARSPITYVKNIQTPLMLIEGEADLRTPPAAGGEQMFRALKYLHKTVVMVRFPGESHELSRSGKPNHRVERLEHITAWFDKYLQGREIHTYDVQ